MPTLGNPLIPFGRDRRTQRLDARFDELLAKLRKNRPGEDVEPVRRAYEMASNQHREQTRQSGEPYLIHPLEVAHILADMKLDATTVCAALLTTSSRILGSRPTSSPCSSARKSPDWWRA